jgi:hypothetical protein
MLQIFPEAVFIGTGFIAFVTLSYPFGIFFVSLIEATAVYHGLNYINENIRLIGANSSATGRCRTGLQDITLRSVSLFEREFRPTFMSSSIFLTSFIASYILGVLVYLKDELQILGKSYGEEFNTRVYGSVALFSMIIFILMSYRFLNKCDNAVNILASLFLGISTGLLILLQNNGIFGKESLNLLGVPMLRKRTEGGADLYVCSPT